MYGITKSGLFTSTMDDVDGVTADINKALIIYKYV